MTVLLNNICTFCAGIGVAHSDREAQDEAGGKVDRTKTTIQPFHRGVIIIIIIIILLFMPLFLNKYYSINITHGCNNKQ